MGALAGDHGCDFRENRLLRACEIRPVDEFIARAAAVLRVRVGGTRATSAIDAVVVAMADGAGGASVLSSDRGDLGALGRHTTNPVTLSPV